MIALAKRYGKEPAFLRDIAKSEGLSEKYLSLLVIPLREKGLIKSYRGSKGGYTLARTSANITLNDIVVPLEGGFDMIECNRNTESCEKSSNCAARNIWCGLAKHISIYLHSFTLEEIANLQMDKDNVMYYI